MPKLKPATQAARREVILDAAERCFARSGFHRSTMQDICREAAVSPGALYLYFSSKEDLIAGLCDRERSAFDDKIRMLSDAPDFLAALEKIAQHYFVETPAHKRLFSVEMGVEATRNPTVAGISQQLECSVTTAFQDLFQRLAAAGRIAPDLSIKEVTDVFQIMGDGLFWRRAVVPTFDAAKVLPAMMRALHDLLKPVAMPASGTRVTRPAKSASRAATVVADAKRRPPAAPRKPAAKKKSEMSR